MTLKEAYIYIFRILNKYWYATHDDGLGDILSEMNPFLWKDGNSADPAAWEDWLRVVQTVTSKESITEAEAMKAMISLLKDYHEQGWVDLAKVIEHFEK